MIGLIDIGGTKTLACCVAGEQRTKVERRPTPQNHPVATLIEMLDEVRGGEPLEAIGVAAPGTFDRASVTFRSPPNLSDQWQGLDLGTPLRDYFGCVVVLENDANCAALAERRDGVAKGHDNVVYVTVSTGIGTGVISGGRLVTGRADTEGGHQVLLPGWMGGPECGCGGQGCLEALASGAAIERRFGQPAEKLETPSAWEEVGHWLGLGIVNAIAFHDPDIVVLGGGVTQQWDRFVGPMMETIETQMKIFNIPPVVQGTLNDDRNLWGVLSLIEQGVVGATR